MLPPVRSTRTHVQPITIESSDSLMELEKPSDSEVADLTPAVPYMRLYKRMTNEDLKLLMALFCETTNPTMEEQLKVATRIGRNVVTVKRWFQKKRTAMRKMSSSEPTPSAKRRRITGRSPLPLTKDSSTGSTSLDHLTEPSCTLRPAAFASTVDNASNQEAVFTHEMLTEEASFAGAYEHDQKLQGLLSPQSAGAISGGSVSDSFDACHIRQPTLEWACERQSKRRRTKCDVTAAAVPRRSLAADKSPELGPALYLLSLAALGHDTSRPVPADDVLYGASMLMALKHSLAPALVASA